MFANEVKPPSHYLEQELLKRRISHSKLAIALGISPSHIGGLCSNRSRISPRMALKLERVLGIKAEDWLRMRADYDLWEIRRWWGGPYGTPKA